MNPSSRLRGCSPWPVGSRFFLTPRIPVWSQRIVALAVPCILSAGYGVILFGFPPPGGGFGSFAEVRVLFSHADALMAARIYFLAFDLLVGR